MSQESSMTDLVTMNSQKEKEENAWPLQLIAERHLRMSGSVIGHPGHPSVDPRAAPLLSFPWSIDRVQLHSVSSCAHVKERHALILGRDFEIREPRPGARH